MAEFKHVRPAGEAIFKDRYITKIKELMMPWQEGLKGEFGLVGAPLSKSSISHSGSAFAPGSIRAAMQSYSTYSGEMGVDLKDRVIVDFGDVDLHPTDIPGSQEQIYEGVKEVLDTEAADHWLVLGGDHSISFPSIRAFRDTFGRIGVIQFDAHHDLRNLEDGGPTNGTPFRSLLEHQVLEGKDLIQIGIRDFTNGKAYDQFAKEKGVTVFTMGDVRKQTIEDLVDQSLKQLEDQVDVIYLSVDMDVLDQAFAPGCPAIGPGGMDSWTLLEGVYHAARHPKVRAMDIVEIDPTVDFRNMTSRVAANVILSYIKAKN